MPVARSGKRTRLRLRLRLLRQQLAPPRRHHLLPPVATQEAANHHRQWARDLPPRLLLRQPGPRMLVLSVAVAASTSLAVRGTVAAHAAPRPCCPRWRRAATWTRLTPPHRVVVIMVVVIMVAQGSGVVEVVWPLPCGAATVRPPLPLGRPRHLHALH